MRAFITAVLGAVAGTVATDAAAAGPDAGGARAMLGVPRLGGHQQRVVGLSGGFVWSLGDDGLWLGRNPRSLRPVRVVAPADGGRVADGAVGRDVLVSLLDVDLPSGGASQALVGLHPRTGEVVWTTGPGLDLVDVAAAADRVVAVDRRTWLAFRVDEGRMVPLVPVRDGVPVSVDVRAAAVAEDGTALLVSGLRVWLVDRQDRVQWEAEAHLTGLPAFSASGREVALPVADHVELRDVASGEVLERWDAERPPITIAVSADGRELVWSDPWSTYRARRGKDVVELDRPTVAAAWEGRVVYLAPSEGPQPVKWRGSPPGRSTDEAPWVPLRCVTDTTGAVVAASGPTGLVRWEVGAGRTERGDRMALPVPFGADLALSPDGAEVWIGPTGQPAQRWVRTWTAGSPSAFAAGRWWTADSALHSRDAAGVAWSSPETLAPSRHLWMSASGRTGVLATDAGLAWFDAETGAPRPLGLPPGLIDGDGEVLVDDGQLVVWDDAAAFVVGELGRRALDLGGARPLALRGDWLAAAHGRRLELWSVAAGAPVRVLGEAASHVSCAGFSGDGTQLVSGSYDGTLRMWDVPPQAPPSPAPGRIAAAPRSVPGAAVARTLPFPQEPAAELAMADGLAWVVGERGTAVGFAVDTGEAVWRWDRPAAAVGGGASLVVADDWGVHGVGADGTRAWTVAASFVPREVHAIGDAVVAVRDEELAVVVRGRAVVDVPRRGGIVWPLPGGEVWVEDWAAPSLGAPIVALSDDGAFAAVAVGPGRIGVQPRAGGARFEVALRGARVGWAAFSPDAARLAVATELEVVVIDVATRRIAARLATPRPWSRVVWADGLTVLGIDGAGLEPVRWSVGAAGAAPSPYGVRPGVVRSCAVDPDGRAVAVGDDAGTWWFSAEDGALLGTVPGRAGVFGAGGRLVVIDRGDLAAYDAPDRQAWRLRLDPASVAVVGDQLVMNNGGFTLAGRGVEPTVPGRVLAAATDGSTVVARVGKALQIVRSDGAVVPVAPAPCVDAAGRCDRAVSATTQVTWTRPPWTSPTVQAVDLDGGPATVIPLGLYGGGARPELLVGDELVVSRGTTLERWSTETSARTEVVELGARASCVAASADGGTLAVTDDDGELIVFRR